MYNLWVLFLFMCGRIGFGPFVNLNFKLKPEVLLTKLQLIFSRTLDLIYPEAYQRWTWKRQMMDDLKTKILSPLRQQHDG